MKKTKQPIINNIFIKHLKTLDLHGETVDVARILTIDFLKDNMNIEKQVVIVHGIGTGLIKAEVHRILKRNRKILKFYLENAGCTIVLFNEEKDKKLLV